MQPVVWIPERTPSAERERLGALATLQVFPAAGSIPEPTGEVDLMVAAYGNARAVEVAQHLGEKLRAVQSFSAGVDAIAATLPSGATLCDAAGVHDVAVAEWVVMVILASQRRLPESLDGQRAGVWLPERLIGQDLEGSRVVIVGAGAIGRAVEARLTPFGVTFERVARRARPGVRPFGDLAAILPDADIVVILLPLTEETRAIIDSSLLARMQPGALLVNASRGAVVDNVAMTEAVLAGRIRVAVDVTDPEPLPAGHPLWSAPGALITPHVASSVRAEEGRAWQLVFDQVSRLARGESLENVVTDGY